MTSSTKKEVHNVLHCCERRTKPQVTRTDNLVKLGRVVFDMYVKNVKGQTETHTYIHFLYSTYKFDRVTMRLLITILCTITGAK